MLLRSLVAGTRPPSAFDTARVRACAESLLRKRTRDVERAWPVLVDSLGPRFRPAFTAYAAGSPLPAAGGALADGREFAAWLRTRGAVTDVARRAVLAFDLQWNRCPFGRRCFAVGAVILSAPHWLVLGLRLPLFGVHTFTIPLGCRGQAVRGPA